jgi:hypothetical protein
VFQTNTNRRKLNHFCRWSNGNSPNISTALDHINSNLLFSDFGSDVVPYTVIVVTNGNSQIPSQTAHSAFALKQNVDKVRNGTNLKITKYLNFKINVLDKSSDL